LSAWSIGSSAAIAILSALGGLLADATSPRTAIAVAGLLILASPLLLPRRQDSALVPRIGDSRDDHAPGTRVPEAGHRH
jgi:hypothetical protein